VLADQSALHDARPSLESVCQIVCTLIKLSCGKPGFLVEFVHGLKPVAIDEEFSNF
jgi:hypothetical protein